MAKPLGFMDFLNVDYTRGGDEQQARNAKKRKLDIGAGTNAEYSSTNPPKEQDDDLQLGFVDRDVRPEELTTADEVLLCSTSPCVWSVTQVGATQINDGRPGPVAAQLLDAWSALVGVDIRKQANTFANR